MKMSIILTTIFFYSFIVSASNNTCVKYFDSSKSFSTIEEFPFINLISREEIKVIEFIKNKVSHESFDILTIYISDYYANTSNKSLITKPILDRNLSVKALWYLDRLIEFQLSIRFDTNLMLELLKFRNQSYNEIVNTKSGLFIKKLTFAFKVVQALGFNKRNKIITQLPYGFGNQWTGNKLENSLLFLKYSNLTTRNYLKAVYYIFFSSMALAIVQALNNDNNKYLMTNDSSFNLMYNVNPEYSFSKILNMTSEEKSKLIIEIKKLSDDPNNSFTPAEREIMKSLE